MVKIAKYSNLLVGLFLFVTAILNVVYIFSALKPFVFTMTLYEGLFGLLMVLSSLCTKMKCIRNNFLFLLTGTGKGIFNIFVGCILFYCGGSDNLNVLILIVGWTCIATGIVFIFLAQVRQLSEADISNKEIMAGV